MKTYSFPDNLMCRLMVCDTPPDYSSEGLEAALKKLDADLRNALLMRYRDGMTFSGIASSMGVTSARAERLVDNALRTLRRQENRSLFVLAPVS